MLAVLATATRMKGGAGWAAVIIVTTTVPVYLANLTRDIAVDYYLVFVYPAYLLNALCMPSLWFFTRSQFDKTFRYNTRYLLHALPAIVSLLSHIIYYAPLSAEQIEAERVFMEAGGENLPAIINDVIVFAQFLAYYLAIFIYIRNRKKLLQDNFSDSDYFETRWIPHFHIVFFALIFVVFAAYVINPRNDTWLFPILNVIGMAYLVYIVIFHSIAAYIHRLPDAATIEHSEKTAHQPTMTDEQMKEICLRVTDFLQSSGAYTNPGLTLSMLSAETGVTNKNISHSFNTYLKKNFFEIINEMRVEEAKKRLLANAGNYTVESVAEDCGFRSRSTFFLAFKKAEGKTPMQWLKSLHIAY